MNPSETDITLIEKYFDAELSDAEISALTARLKTDENLKMMFDREKVLVDAIRYDGFQEDLRYLKDLDVTLQEQDEIRNDTEERGNVIPINSPVKKWYYLVAAGLVGVLIAAKILFTSYSESPDQLFEAYFTPYPNMFEPTVRGTGTVSTRSEAFQAYEQGNYQKAATLFNELIKSKKEPGVLLLLGNSNLILGHLDEAKQNFTTLNKDFDELDIQSKWYLSLCYLKSGDVERAKNMLRELGKTEISYATKAKELLEKVN